MKNLMTLLFLASTVCSDLSTELILRFKHLSGQMQNFVVGYIYSASLKSQLVDNLPKVKQVNELIDSMFDTDTGTFSEGFEAIPLVSSLNSDSSIGGCSSVPRSSDCTLFDHPKMDLPETEHTKRETIQSNVGFSYSTPAERSPEEAPRKDGLKASEFSCNQLSVDKPWQKENGRKTEQKWLTGSSLDKSSTPAQFAGMSSNSADLTQSVKEISLKKKTRPIVTSLDSSSTSNQVSSKAMAKPFQKKMAGNKRPREDLLDMSSNSTELSQSGKELLPKKGTHSGATSLELISASTQLRFKAAKPVQEKMAGERRPRKGLLDPSSNSTKLSPSVKELFSKKGTCSRVTSLDSSSTLDQLPSKAMAKPFHKNMIGDKRPGGTSLDRSLKSTSQLVNKSCHMKETQPKGASLVRSSNISKLPRSRSFHSSSRNSTSTCTDSISSTFLKHSQPNTSRTEKVSRIEKVHSVQENALDLSSNVTPLASKSAPYPCNKPVDNVKVVERSSSFSTNRHQHSQLLKKPLTGKKSSSTESPAHQVYPHNKHRHSLPSIQCPGSNDSTTTKSFLSSYSIPKIKTKVDTSNNEITVSPHRNQNQPPPAKISNCSIPATKQSQRQSRQGQNLFLGNSKFITSKFGKLTSLRISTPECNPGSKGILDKQGLLGKVDY